MGILSIAIALLGILCVEVTSYYTPRGVSHYNLYRLRTQKSALKAQLDPTVASGVYEAQISGTAIAGLAGTSAILVAAGIVWWNVIVPQKRTEVALSKRNGEISEYLDDLREAKEGDKGFERWLMSDWLNKTPGSQKPGALPFLKKAKWNSGDNPVLVAFAGIMALVITTSLAERGASVLSSSPSKSEGTSLSYMFRPHAVNAMERNGVTYTKSALQGLEYYDYPAKSSSKPLPVVSRGKNVVLNVRGYLAGRQGWIFLDTFNSAIGEAVRIQNLGEADCSPAVIKGLEVGLLGDDNGMQAMRKGDKRRLILSSQLGYQNEGQAPQPADEGAKRRLFSTVLNPVRGRREEAAFGGDSIVGKIILDTEVVRISGGKGG